MPRDEHSADTSGGGVYNTTLVGVRQEDDLRARLRAVEGERDRLREQRDALVETAERLHRLIVPAVVGKPRGPKNSAQVARESERSALRELVLPIVESMLRIRAEGPETGPTREEHGLETAAKWHDEQAAELKRERKRIREWSRRNNDGNPDLGGTWVQDTVPAQLTVHKEAAIHFRSLLAQLERTVGG